HMEDPLADPACVPLFFAARLAKKHVDTVLSGEGADELFGGYRIYREPNDLKIFQLIPKKIHAMLQRLAALLPEGIKGRSFIMRGTTPLKERYIGNAKMFEENEKEQFLKNYDNRIMYQHITKE